MSGPRISNDVHQRVFFGEEIVDLAENEDPISLESFKVLIEEEEEEDEDNRKSYFLFAFVYSSYSGCPFKHLYSAENIIHWYPLAGTTDPCTGEEIEKIEYYFYVKGQKNAIHMGDVVRQSPQTISKQDEMGIVGFTTDLLIWSVSAEDEPSRMMALLAIAYQYSVGLCRHINSTDRIDTSEILRSLGVGYSEPERRNEEEHRKKISNRLYKYIVHRIANHIRMKKLTCSDINVLLSSIKHDAANFVAQKLVKLDPSVNEKSEDFSRIPHIVINALAAAMQESLTEPPVTKRAHGP